jgi:hypothetical protein
MTYVRVYVGLLHHLSHCLRNYMYNSFCLSYSGWLILRPLPRTLLARPADNPAPYKTANCEEWRSFPPFFSLPLLRDAEEWRIDFTQRRVK